MISSPRTTTAPTGTSPAAMAVRAPPSATSMKARSAAVPLGSIMRRKLAAAPSERDSLGHARRRRYPSLGFLELQRAARTHRHHDVIAVVEASLEQRERERVLDQPLDRPLERPRPERRIVAFLGQQPLRLRSDLHRDLALGQQLVEPLELQLDD